MGNKDSFNISDDELEKELDEIRKGKDFEDKKKKFKSYFNELDSIPNFYLLSQEEQLKITKEIMNRNNNTEKK